MEDAFMVGLSFIAIGAAVILGMARCDADLALRDRCVYECASQRQMHVDRCEPRRALCVKGDRYELVRWQR